MTLDETIILYKEKLRQTKDLDQRSEYLNIVSWLQDLKTFYELKKSKQKMSFTELYDNVIKHGKLRFNRSDEVYRAYCPKCREPVVVQRPHSSRQAMRFICKHCKTDFTVKIDFLYEDEMYLGG